MAGLVWAFWLGGAVALLSGAAAWHFMDIFSASLLEAVVLPVLLGLSVCYLAIWSGAQSGWFEAGGNGGCDSGDGGGCDGA